MSGFAANVLRLGSGHTLAQLINIATIPVVTRLYSPQEFGYYSVYLGIATMLAPVLSLRFSNFIALPAQEGDASALLLLSFFFVTVASAVGIPAILAIAGETLPGFRDNPLFGYLIWLPIGVLCLSITDSVASWNLRRKQFTTMSMARVIEVLIDRAIGLGLGVLGGIGALGLLWGRMIGALFSAAFSSRRGVASSVWEHWRGLSYRDVRRVFLEFRANALFASAATLASAGSRELPGVVIASVYGVGAAGFYGLCLRILNLPLMTIGDVVARVHYQHMAEMVRDGRNVVPQLFTVMRYMFYIVFPLMLILIWCGDAIFALAFGREWTEAGRYAQILVIGIVFTFVHRVPSVLFDVLLLNRARVWFEALLLAVRLAALVVAAGMSLPIYNALFAMLCVSVLVILLSAGYLFNAVNVGWRHWAGYLARLSLRFWPMFIALPLLRERWSIPHPGIMVGALFPLVAMQMLAICIHDRELRDRVVRLLGTRWGRRWL